jgi:hypothetical protein
MNAAAWIALAGVVVTGIVVILTNMVLFTRFLALLEGRLDVFKTALTGELNVMRAEHKALVESTNVAMGRMQTDHERLERRAERLDSRMGHIERTVGRSTPLGES